MRLFRFNMARCREPRGLDTRNTCRHLPIVGCARGREAESRRCPLPWKESSRVAFLRLRLHIPDHEADRKLRNKVF